MLEDVFYDLSLDSSWRKRLFEANFHQAFPIDAGHLDDVPGRIAEPIKKFNLRFLAAKVPPQETESWLSDGGMIVFKFWAQEYPSVSRFSGNNPDSE